MRYFIVVVLVRSKLVIFVVRFGDLQNERENCRNSYGKRSTWKCYRFFCGRITNLAKIRHYAAVTHLYRQHFDGTSYRLGPFLVHRAMCPVHSSACLKMRTRKTKSASLLGDPMLVWKNSILSSSFCVWFWIFFQRTLSVKSVREMCMYAVILRWKSTLQYANMYAGDTGCTNLVVMRRLTTYYLSASKFQFVSLLLLLTLPACRCQKCFILSISLTLFFMCQSTRRNPYSINHLNNASDSGSTSVYP